ncbi:uncharacterized protein PODANS_5_3840 [Podospora anserina S mat+]|uniref:Podospora anserina S mat+ genomic DNA chromosome 5, supercontig 4 n=1 Tax=Podospora anserina (strain S / ATCC MYA-4624 / DSM 980 / FGSC 10383) TaxID=515849 RepID=B2ALJ7_PODAN|nr:uncharacterized protein PODANS_5_3840 [Podospora anserina S mat+]CAP64835.1 unnamed protein product [Podospora anserina S mat+]CDP29346.1 Putative protein of unknown function [Podospora anserina S mat+]
MAETKLKDLSSLRPSLKKLINAPFASPATTPAPPQIRNIYQRLSREAKSRKYGERPWITIAVRFPPLPFPFFSLTLPPCPQAATTFTLNSPSSLSHLHSTSSSLTPHPTLPSLTPPLTPLLLAELIREVGLKCISFNGIPRTINCLNAFRSDLEVNPWSSSLSSVPSRTVTTSNINNTISRGNALWKSIYTPHHGKLTQKLALAHPDLPGYILQGHYAMLLADPPRHVEGGVPRQARLGRCLTSLVAIACLRAQRGVGPQVLSHVYGLRKAVEQGLHREEFEDEEEREGMERLAGDEGCEWILESVDKIARAIGGGGFAGWEREVDQDQDQEDGVEDDTRLDGEVSEVGNVAEEMEEELQGGTGSGSGSGSGRGRESKL